MESKEIPNPDLQKVSGFLREQVEICHELTTAVRSTFFKETNRAAQDDTLKMMMKLVGATAVAAGAMSRIKGTEINQTITVLRAQKEGAYPPTAKTNSPGEGRPPKTRKRIAPGRGHPPRTRKRMVRIERAARVAREAKAGRPAGKSQRSQDRLSHGADADAAPGRLARHCPREAGRGADEAMRQQDHAAHAGH